MSKSDKRHILGGPPIFSIKADEGIKKLGRIQQENAHKAANPKPLKRKKMG
jgi:hypothetical protein